VPAHDEPPVPPEQRVVFRQVVEALLTHALRGRVTPRLRERLRRAGLDVDRPLLPAYPVSQWAACLDVIAEEAYPHLPREDAFARMAADHVDGYGHTLVGKALYGVMRVLGPRRTLKRMTENLRSSDNYTRVTVTELGAGLWSLHFNTRVVAPGYAEGVIAGLLRVAGARNVQAVRAEEHEDSLVMHVRWEEPPG
jgi:uncharacterized protein (TIGR02265 family)